MIRFHKQASLEMEVSIRFYETQKRGLGLRFMMAVEAASERIKEHPGAGTPLKSKDGPLRRYLLGDFPFGIIYEAEKQDVLVWAVMHLSRKPDYWAKRIRS